MAVVTLPAMSRPLLLMAISYCYTQRNNQQLVLIHPDTKNSFTPFSVTLSCLYVCLFSLYECLSCTNPASWLPESNNCYVMLCAMQVCQIVFLCLGTVVIKKLSAVLLNVTDDVSHFYLVAVLR